MNRPLIYIYYCVLFFETVRLGKPARMRTLRIVQGMVSGPRRMSRAIKEAKTAPLAEKSDHVIEANDRCELDT